MRPQNINLPAVVTDATYYGINPSSVDIGPALNALLADVSAAGRGQRQTVLIATGTYQLATTVVHPANVTVLGSGPGTVIQTDASLAIAWDFALGYIRSELGNLQLQGPGRTDPNNFAARSGIGVDLAQSQQVILHHLQIWDYLTGLRMTNGVSFSSYHSVGPHVEVNRCTTGIDARQQINVSRIFDSRVFYSYGVADEGIGIDVDSPGGLQIQNCAVEAADTCIRARNTTATCACIVNNNFLEPGTNPTTLTVGSLYDIEITNISDGTEMFRLEGNIQSGNSGDISLPLEGFMYSDAYSRAFFGARFSGAGVPKRNYIYNGGFGYYNLPDALPNWFGGGVSPTLTESLTFATGVRSLSVTAPGATNSTVFATFVVSDPGVEWVTCGIRYQVGAGNVGFFFTGTVGGNNAQYTDPVPSAGVWQVAEVQVRVDPANRTGSISINPDSVNGTGNVLVDEVWAVAGRYAVPSTQYGERIQLLPAPIRLINRTGLTGLDLFGPINILTLPSTLGAPLDDLSTAPLGVVGGVYRLGVNMTGFASTAVLGGPVYAFLNIPALGATSIAAGVHQVMASFGQTWHQGEVTVRSTTVSGGMVPYTGLATSYTVDLVAWVLQ